MKINLHCTKCSPLITIVVSPCLHEELMNGAGGCKLCLLIAETILFNRLSSIYLYKLFQ